MFGKSVFIKRSNICNGYGVFSKRKIYKGEIITWYYGKIINNKNILSNRYAIRYDDNNERLLIGVSDINKITYGKGIAQFANDAICYDLTCKNNNSYFLKKGRYILLVALEDIEKNTEILVSYGIDYWLNEIEENFNEYDNNFRNIIFILSELIYMIEKNCKCEIYEYKGLFDEYKLYFELKKKKRLCKYSEKIHEDDNFYISLKWKGLNEDILQIYYTCKTCNMSDFDYLIEEVENGLLNKIENDYIS